jgi:hypothetical protein
MKLIFENWRKYLKEEITKTQRKIFVLVGPPSVGKSYWIKETFGHDPNMSVDPYVISRDDIANSVADKMGWTYDDLFVPPSEGAEEGDSDEKYGTVVKSPPYMTWQLLSYDKVVEANNKIHQLFMQRVSGAQPSNRDIIVDMTNMNAQARSGALKAIEGAEEDYQKIAVVFEFEDAEEIIKSIAAKRAEEERKKGKSKTIPPEAFDRMFKAFQKIDPSEGFDDVISVDNREALRALAGGQEEQSETPI